GPWRAYQKEPGAGLAISAYSSWPWSSEVHFHRQLDDPGVGGSIDAPEVAAVSACGGIVEFGMVEDVKELSAKLEPDAFMRPEWEEILDEPRIHVGASRPAECAFADISKASY